MADIRLTIDDSDVIQSLTNIEKKLSDVGEQAKDTGKAIEASFDGPDADAKRAAASLAEYQAAQEKLKVSSQERIAQNAKMREGLEKYRKEQSELNKTTDEGAKKNVEFASALKESTNGLNSGATAAKSAETATKGATIAQRAFNFVMSINPIGIVIAALVLLVNQFRKYQGVIDFASKITAQIGAVMTVVTDRVISLGKAVYSLVTLDWAGFGKNSMDAIDGFGESVSNAWQQAGQLADATTALRDAQLAAALSTAKLQAASDKAQAAAQDEAKTFNERILLLRKAAAIEAEIAKIKVGFAEQDAANARAEFALSNGNVAAKEALLEKELALQEARNGADKTRIALLQQLNALEKQRTEFITKSVEDVRKLVDKLDVDLQDDPIEKAMEQVRQRIEAQISSIEEGLKKLKEVEKLRPLNDEEIKLRQDLQDKTVEVIEDGEKAIAAALLEGIKKQSDIDQKKKDAAKAAADERIDDAKRLLKEALELEQSKIDITEAEFKNFIATLKARGASEADVKTEQLEFTNRVNGERLAAELAYNESLLKITSPGTDAEIIKARIQELEVLLEGIDIPAPKEKDGKPITMFDLLGIKFDDPEQEKAIQESISRIIDSLGQLAQARVDEAEAATQAANEKVEAAEDALSKEQDLAKEGFANNVDLKKKELAEAQKARAIALKEEEKAKKQQIAIDSAVQLSSLITTAANIFKGFSSIPIIGQVLAVVSVAAMFASFAAAKASALKAANAPKLRRGRKFDGPTHEQGNEDMVFDGRTAYAVEKDEWLIGTAHSREHDQFLSRLNKGEYKGINLLEAAANARTDNQSPLSESSPRIRKMEERKAELSHQSHYQALAKAYEKSADRITAEIRKKPTVFPWKNGYKVIVQTDGGTDTKTVLPQE